ncbi:MAG: acyltransferase [Fibrobacter sp.]|nr:acyltransferase [Fibrobacter sp.]
MATNKTRIGWIDEFKGFVLLLVCLFHIEQNFPNAHLGMWHLSALRMSAFFFISGFLFSTKRFSDFKSYFIHKTKVLLIPYLYLSLLFFAIDPVVYNFALYPKSPTMTVVNTIPDINNTWQYIYWNIAKIFIAGKSSVGAGPLWFVFTLYSVSLLFYFLHQASYKFVNRTMFITVMAIEGLLCGWLLNINHMHLPLGIERDLTILFFFGCGWLCKEPIKKIHSAISAGAAHAAKNTAIVAAIGIASFGAYAFLESPSPNFSIMNNDLGKSLPQFVASSITGIIGLVATFLLASKIPDIAPIRICKGILRNISRNALVILAVHWWIVLILRLFFRQQINQPGIAYIAIPIVALGTIAAIPLFRCRLYKLLGKEKISVRESLNIRE